ncbi:MAG: EAL domain-containing protein, partial [Alphaproteobacteria bacterium]|nr:EAL domain-containing protein [Alphaproteobacteria bacterium]
VPPRLLGLEITESALMPDSALAAETLTSLVELGVELSIDDFGTGYSSLNYLKRLPVGKLKIDRSFVADITNNPLDGAIAHAIIQLGHSLGMKVLAEGVEAQAQANMLSDLGCDQIQGLLISPPLPADAFVDFVNRRTGRREPHL